MSADMTKQPRDASRDATGSAHGLQHVESDSSTSMAWWLRCLRQWLSLEPSILLQQTSNMTHHSER